MFRKFRIEQFLNFLYIWNVLKPLLLTPKPSKTEYYFQTYFQTIFAKFLRVRKDQIVPKNFRTSKTELFRKPQKWKVGKFCLSQGLTIAGPMSIGLRRVYRGKGAKKWKNTIFDRKKGPFYPPLAQIFCHNFHSDFNNYFKIKKLALSYNFYNWKP